MINTLYLPELREMIALGDVAEMREFCTALHPARKQDVSLLKEFVALDDGSLHHIDGAWNVSDPLSKLSSSKGVNQTRAALQEVLRTGMYAPRFSVVQRRRQPMPRRATQ